MDNARRRAAEAWEWLVAEHPWVFVAAVFVVANLVWVRLDRLPPMWDQSWYLDGGELLYRALNQGGLIGLAKVFTVLNGTKAPLLSLLPVPLYLLFGHSYHVALGVNLVLMTVTSYYVFRLAKALRGRRAGIYAVILLNLLPLVAGLSREFLVETCLTAMVVAWHVYLLESDDLRARGTWWRLGIVLGLGMLTKILFPLYILGGSVYVLWRRVRADRAVRRDLLAVFGATLGTGAVVAATWYARNLRGAISAAANSGFGSVASDYGSRSVLAWQTLSAYWLRVAVDVVSPLLALFLTVVLVAVLVARWRGRLDAPVFRDAGAPRALVWWIAVPFVVLSLGVNKDIRFLAPALPALAILGAAGLDALTLRRSSAWFTGGALLAVFVPYLLGSFAAPAELGGLGPGARSVLLAGTGGYVRAPSAESWPIAEVERAIEAEATNAGLTSPRVTLLFDHPRINVNNLQYQRDFTGGVVVYQSSPYMTPLTDAAGERLVLENSDYLVTKSRDLGPEFVNVLNARIAADVEAGGLGWVEVGRRTLPDGSDLVVWRRRG